MINEHKATMEYLTEHSGKKIDTPEAVYYLYNLFREQVKLVLAKLSVHLRIIGNLKKKKRLYRRCRT